MQKQLTVTATTTVTSITIDPVGGQLYLQGTLTVPVPGGGTAVVQQWSENVTALLNPTDVAAAMQLVTRAQAWVDAKMP